MYMNAIITLSLAFMSLITLSFGGYLAFMDKSGWGWFLFLGFIMFLVIAGYTQNNEENQE